MTVYHSGTAVTGDTLTTASGQVLGVAAAAADLTAALAKAYAAVDKSSLDGLHRRSDIGARSRKAMNG